MGDVCGSRSTGYPCGGSMVNLTSVSAEYNFTTYCEGFRSWSGKADKSDSYIEYSSPSSHRAFPESRPELSRLCTESQRPVVASEVEGATPKINSSTKPNYHSKALL